MYENRTMKPLEIVLRRGMGDKGESQGVNLRYIVNIYVNITMSSLYNNKLI
jgi:hypothetical protein